MSSTAPRRPWLTRTVVALGVVSLLTDAASEMVMPLLPAFLATIGGGALALGWIEGMADATASVLKLLAGRWADRIGKNRPFVLAGYGLSSIVRPLVSLAGAPLHVLGVRVADRVGKGLRSSPRDALLVGAVGAEHRGAAFGFHRAMDHAGAIVGPLLALAVITFVTRDLRVVFALSAIPGALAVIAIVAGVRETKAEEREPVVAVAAAQSGAVGDLEPRRGDLVRFLLPLALFSLGKASDVFLVLKAGSERAPLEALPLLWIALHVVKSATSVPGGTLADRWGAKRAIVLGWAVFVAVYGALAFAESPMWIATLTIVYGLHAGLSEAPERALVAAIVPRLRRGTGFGWYHLTQGFLSLAASVLFGTLWEAFGSEVAFLAGAGLGLAGIVALLVLAPLPRAPEVR